MKRVWPDANGKLPFASLALVMSVGPAPAGVGG